jgi:hypothetical protein
VIFVVNLPPDFIFIYLIRFAGVAAKGGLLLVPSAADVTLESLTDETT